MWKKIKRAFTITTRAEVFLITFPLALGAVKRGEDYLIQYPGFVGRLLFACCIGAVFLCAAKMLQAVDLATSFVSD